MRKKFRLIARILGLAIIFIIFFTLPFNDALKLNIFLIAIYLFFRLFSFLLKKILWKIRNKLILSYLFIAFVPLALIALLSYLTFYFFFSRYGNYIVTKEINYRINFLERIIELNKPDIPKQYNIGKISNKDKISEFNNLLINLNEKAGKNKTGIFFYKDKFNFYYYDNNTIFYREITVETLESIRDYTLWNPSFILLKDSGGGSEVNHIYVDFELSVDKDKKDEGGNILDFPSIPSPMKIINFDKERVSSSIMTTKFDFSFALDKFKSTMFSEATRDFERNFFYAITILIIFFSLLYLISFFLGIILARSITQSISNLYTATKKLKEKNFSYRIKKIPSDQLGDVALSFNDMAESLENLLEEEKENERLKRDLELANKMQRKLLPIYGLDKNDLVLSGLSITAQDVGGDYYDYFITKNGNIFFSIADVVGKGMSAAFYMAEIKGIVKGYSEYSNDLVKIVERINRAIYKTLEKNSFVTAIIGYIDTRKKKVNIVRAGHPHPLIIRENGEVEQIESTGIALGLKESIKNHIEKISFSINKGDILLFYTDGLSEMKNEKGELFTSKGIISILKNNKFSSIYDIKNLIKQTVYAHIGSNYIKDDITLLMILYKKNEEK